MIEIRRAAAADVEGLRALFACAFGHPVSAEHWRWKYERAYLGSASLVALAGGEVVAHYGGLRQRSVRGHAALDAYQGVDIMTHPAWRGRFFGRRGLLVQLAEAFFAEYPMDYYFGFPSLRHARLNELLLGYEPHRLVSELRRPLSAEEARSASDVELGWESLTAREVDSLWDETRSELELSIAKESAYFFWRFRDHPTASYELAVLRGWGGRPRALAVLGWREGTLRVLDFLAPGARRLRRLLGALQALGARRGAREILLWAHPREGAATVLRELGYRSSDGVPCVVKLLGTSLGGAAFFDGYCYRLGDYDAA